MRAADAAAAGHGHLLAGTSDLDGPVEVMVVTEEPGIGLGARCAGTADADPGREIGDGPPAVQVRVGARPVPLWTVVHEPTDDRPATAAVFAGEAGGRWLWLVLRPASAMLLLRDEWILARRLRPRSAAARDAVRGPPARLVRRPPAAARP